MNKRLEKVIKELKFADYDFLAKSDEKTVEKAKKVLGYNMPSQLEEWLRVYNGGAIGTTVDFCSTDKKHNGFEWELLTFKEYNSSYYKKTWNLPKNLVCFAIENTGDPVCFEKNGGENIYTYFPEDDALTKYKDLADYIEDTINNMFLMETAFERYFEKLNKSYEDKFNTKPTISYTSSLNKKLIVSKPDKEDYVEWQPLKQSGKANLEKLEKKLGFKLGYDLKDYYTTYLFYTLEGKFKGKQLDFYPIADENNLAKIIEQQYNDGQWAFPNSQTFLLGHATVAGNDNFYIYFDNKDNKIFLYDNEAKKKVKLKPLSFVVATMQAPFSKKNKK